MSVRRLDKQEKDWRYQQDGRREKIRGTKLNEESWCVCEVHRAGIGLNGGRGGTEMKNQWSYRPELSWEAGLKIAHLT